MLDMYKIVIHRINSLKFNVTINMKSLKPRKRKQNS